MVAKSMDVTMYAPFIGKDPSLIELSLGFSHGFRGLRESMSFGGGASSGGSAGGQGGGSQASNPSRPKSTPASINRGSSQVNSSKGARSAPANNIPASAKQFRAASPLLGGPIRY